MAESIFRHKVQQAGLGDSFVIESAGTGNWHVGDNPDSRTIAVLRQNGISHYSRARQVKPSDFRDFDHIIAMDMANARDLHNWSQAQPDKVSLMSSWNPKSTRIEVPDPYYGDEGDFAQVFTMLDEATECLLTKLRIS